MGCIAGSRAAAAVLPVTLPAPAESCACLARAILQALSAELLLIATDLPAHAYSGPGDPSTDAVFGAVRTSACSSVHERVPALPTGNLLTGLAAGLFGCAQVRCLHSAGWLQQSGVRAHVDACTVQPSNACKLFMGPASGL